MAVVAVGVGRVEVAEPYQAIATAGDGNDEEEERGQGIEAEIQRRKRRESQPVSATTAPRVSAETAIATPDRAPAAIRSE